MNRYEMTLTDVKGGTATHSVEATREIRTPYGWVLPENLKDGDEVVVDGYTFAVSDLRLAEEVE